MKLVSRRVAEIHAKLNSLESEFNHWRTITENGHLARHHSQVRRLASTIQGSLESLQAELTKAKATTQDIPQNVEAWENQILAAHAIWEVFRSKLVLREDELFAFRLAACDDLAWECYYPALSRWDPERKGPPLVYFSSTWSPFVMVSGGAFNDQVHVGRSTASTLREEPFQRVLKALPIPLVSIPWYQFFHLPGSLIIAHEIGHMVEADFSLTNAILEALDGAGVKNRDVWKGWASEMFADVYGCCAMGPAFAGSMVDLNVTDTKSVQQENRPTGLYPTRNLRVRLLCEVLKRTGHENAAIQLRGQWEEVYGPTTAMEDYILDAPRIAAALLDGPYRGSTLSEIIQFPSDWQEKAQQIGTYASNGASIAGYTEPRQLFAAARWIHENSDGKGSEGYADLVRQIVTRTPTGTVRRDASVKKQLAPLRFLDEMMDLREVEKRDRENGRELRELFFSLSAVTPPAGAGQQDLRE